MIENKTIRESLGYRRQLSPIKHLEKPYEYK